MPLKPREMEKLILAAGWIFKELRTPSGSRQGFDKPRFYF